MSNFKSELFLAIIAIVCFTIVLVVVKGPVKNGAESVGNTFETQAKSALPSNSPTP
ncbi:hypothetical protein [Lysinibacillus sphaericus]|uniref:hypothetical protein n=1 Tax=Lysinibacillus sphaericus TaxID=1421 RepID=UPI0018CF1C30|nr:hypothetical protein [Lysinibacillus sphaericus]